MVINFPQVVSTK